MKKTILIMILSFVALGPSQTFAQDGGAVNPIQKLRGLVETRKEVREDARDDVKTINTERKEDLKDLRQRMASSTKDTKARIEDARAKVASSTAKKVEKAQQKVNKNLEKMFDRLEAMIEREEAIMVKIVSRIEKIKAMNGETSEAEKLVAEAKDNLAKAKTALQTLKVTSTGVIAEPTASSTKDAFLGGQNALKKASGEVEKYLRATHKALQKSIGSLKGVSQLKNASTTSSN